MHFTIECDDPLGVLPRALDQVRRLGIDVTSLSAAAKVAQGRVELYLGDVQGSACQTLRERICQIGGVGSVVVNAIE